MLLLGLPSLFVWFDCHVGIDPLRPPPEMGEGANDQFSVDATCALLLKWRRVSTRRVPSSRNGGGVEDDPFIAARPPPEMEEGIDATRVLLPKWRRILT